MEEFDLTRLDIGADFSVGSRGAGLMPSVSLPTPVAVLSGSRFHCLAVEDSESDAESVPGGHTGG